MSFALTERQMMDGTKWVTRRLGWRHAKPGQQLRPVRKCMGLRPGERVQVLRDPITLVGVRREPLRLLIDDEAYGRAACVLEGFGGHPEYQCPHRFVAMFIDTHKGCTLETIVTRLQFDYQHEGPPKASLEDYDHR